MSDNDFADVMEYNSSGDRRFLGSILPRLQSFGHIRLGNSLCQALFALFLGCCHGAPAVAWTPQVETGGEHQQAQDPGKADSVGGIVQSTDPATAGDPQTDPWIHSADQTVLLDSRFDEPLEESRWRLLGGGWKQQKDGETPILSLTRKASDYQPPHRSPLHLALWQTPVGGNFSINVIARSTHEDYNHRDVCFFFGMQDPAHFYYVHLAKRSDPHANQIFLVNGSDRTKISLTTTDGTDWAGTRDWHHVRIGRNCESGEIAVWFDDMQQPIMTANDRTLVEPGWVGVGSFDDTADFQRLQIVVPAQVEKADPGSGQSEANSAPEKEPEPESQKNSGGGGL